MNPDCRYSMAFFTFVVFCCLVCHFTLRAVRSPAVFLVVLNQLGSEWSEIFETPISETLFHQHVVNSSRWLANTFSDKYNGTSTEVSNDSDNGNYVFNCETVSLISCDIQTSVNKYNDIYKRIYQSKLTQTQQIKSTGDQEYNQSIDSNSDPNQESIPKEIEFTRLAISIPINDNVSYLD